MLASILRGPGLFEEGQHGLPHGTSLVEDLLALEWQCSSAGLSRGRLVSYILLVASHIRLLATMSPSVSDMPAGAHVA